MTRNADSSETRLSRRISFGLLSLFESLGWVGIFEVTLPNHRRADAMGLTIDGQVFIVEIKSSVADFRSDDKWGEYLPYCDEFYFAGPLDLASTLFPPDQGLICWDGHETEVVRASTTPPLKTARRQALIKRLFLKAGRDLSHAQIAMTR